MRLQAWWRPWGALAGRPAEVTDEHSSSSYGIPVVVVEGEAYGAAELTGVVVLSPEQELLYGPRVRLGGYQTAVDPAE